MVRLICISLIYSYCAVGYAVNYSLPTGGWYQLQRQSDYVTVCESGDTQPCDVEAGDYQLINFHIPSGDPGHRESVTVIADSAPSFVLVQAESVQNIEFRFPDLWAGANATCPAGKTAVAVTCKATTSHEDGLGFAEDTFLPVFTTVSGPHSSCRATTGHGYDNSDGFDTFIKIEQSTLCL